MKKKILMNLICLSITLMLTKSSYAAIEIVPSKNGKGTDQLVNTRITNSYLLCQTMNAEGESLYGTTVVPHLATNKDWGAVSYLSNSIYGTNTTGQANGVQVVIDSVKYYSTTPNITGVMNWGSNPNVERYTQTSGLLSNYDDSTSSASANVTELYKNKDTRFVDIIGGANKGMAMQETQGKYSSNWGVGTENGYPVTMRAGQFGVYIGNGMQLGYIYLKDGGQGAANSKITFRPVIWNK